MISASWSRIGVDSIAGRPASGDVFSQSMHQVIHTLIVHIVFGFVDPNVVSSSLLPPIPLVIFFQSMCTRSDFFPHESQEPTSVFLFFYFFFFFKSRGWKSD
jgi:hypothetical protein